MILRRSLALLLATVVAGCSVSGGTEPALGTSGPSAPDQQSLTWRPVSLPIGNEPVTVTAYRDGVLVGARTPTKPPTPAAVFVRGEERSPVAVTPASPYGKEAEWLSIEVAGPDALVAVGGARGGAHSNVRWSVWRGSLAGLTEQEQVFSTFGGWGAGEQLGVITPTTGPMLLGSWESAGAGLDADLWVPDGAAWVRQDPSGTALASTRETLVGPRSGTQLGERALVVGSVVDLRDGVHQSPAAWVSAAGNRGWTRVDLRGGSGEAVSAACHEGHCLLAGVVDGVLALWDLALGPAAAPPGSVARLEGVPALPVTDRAALPPPQWWGGAWALAVPGAAATVLLRHGPAGWHTVQGPTGVVTAVTTASATMYAVTRDSAGGSALWAAEATG